VSTVSSFAPDIGRVLWAGKLGIGFATRILGNASNFQRTKYFGDASMNEYLYTGRK